MSVLPAAASGNCTYIGSGDTHILVDAGISCKRIADSLHSLDVKPEELNGIFITHEHSDHIQGLRVLAKNTALGFMGPSRRWTGFEVSIRNTKLMRGCTAQFSRMCR